MLLAARLRVPDLCSSDQGESGPKDKPRGEADGELVKIPVLVCAAMGRRRSVRAAC